MCEIVVCDRIVAADADGVAIACNGCLDIARCLVEQMAATVGRLHQRGIESQGEGVAFERGLDVSFCLVEIRYGKMRGGMIRIDVECAPEIFPRRPEGAHVVLDKTQRNPSVGKARVQHYCALRRHGRLAYAAHLAQPKCQVAPGQRALRSRGRRDA